MGDATKLDYLKAMESFDCFCLSWDLPRGSPEEVDRALTEFANFLWMEGRTSGAATRVYAAFAHRFPRYSRRGDLRLPRFSRAVEGMQKLDPGWTRPPMPWGHVALVCLEAVRQGEALSALAWATGFTTYMRPAELLKLQCADLVPPAGSSPFFALNAFPSERAGRSKVGLADVSVLLDSSVCPWLGPLLDSVAQRGPQEALFALNALQLRNLWRRVNDEVGLKEFRFVMHQLRHGGASHDRLLRLRTREEIKARGAWATDKNVNRYEAAARVQQLEAVAPSSVQQAAVAAIARLPHELTRALRARLHSGSRGPARAPPRTRSPPRPSSSSARGPSERARSHVLAASVPSRSLHLGSARGFVTARLRRAQSKS